MTQISVELKQLLIAAGEGDRVAIDQVYRILYPQLRELAHHRVRRSHNVTSLDTTSLVHESYLRLVNAGKIQVEDRNHFLALAASVMRSVVVDFFRRSRAQRRGGDDVHVTLNSGVIDSSGSTGDEVVRLNELLEELAQIDPRLVSVVEMRYFAGLDTDEIAKCLGVTGRTVLRDLKKIRLLLIDARG
jgi:RNA polymerase sigma factor (TIGR02999 family)